MKYILIIILTILTLNSYAQLKPGFDVQEYLELLRVSRQQTDTLKGDQTPKPLRFKRVYRSAVGPLLKR